MQHPFQRTQYTKTGHPLTPEARFSTDLSGARRFNRHNLIGKRSGLRSVFNKPLNLTDSPPAPLSTFRKFVGNLHPLAFYPAAAGLCYLLSAICYLLLADELQASPLRVHRFDPILHHDRIVYRDCPRPPHGQVLAQVHTVAKPAVTR